MKTTEIRKELETRAARSAWGRGVTAYALELLDKFDDRTRYAAAEGKPLPTLDEKTLLNGAPTWNAYSRGGWGLVLDSDIARRLCTPSELRRTDKGNRAPNSCEDWIDVQARALWQASRAILWAARG